MNIEDLREYCLSKAAVEECFPFDEVTLVFKVGGKMFLLTNLDGDFRFNIKNTPERVIELQEQHPAVIPGFHMNKKYWITVQVDGSIPDKIAYSWIDESYNEVVKGLPAKVRAEFGL